MIRRAPHIVIVGFSLLIFSCLLSGCATAPKKAGTQTATLPVYAINGVSYIPIANFCDQYGINWDYDPLTRSVSLTRDLHRLNVKVGEKLVLIDGKPAYLAHPVEMYQGTVVVPLKFREKLTQIFAQLTARPVEPPRVCLLRIKKAVIDAGHGGKDPGAIGRTGLREKNVNLDIAKRLEKLLTDAGIRVVMTRTNDTFIALQRRVDIANSTGSDLFISIHSNANRVKNLSGFEVYYVTPSLNDARRAMNAAKDASPVIEGSASASDSLNLRATLWDMIYTASRAESIELARSLCRTIDRDLDTKVLGVKGANFYVLKGVRMPAVLIETGFVSNPREELLLKNNFYRQQVAEAIADGIQSYAKDYTIMEASR